MKNTELSHEYFLSAGEVNAEAEMSLPLLISKIIDISTEHANAMGVGNPTMEHLGHGWVLSRLAVEMTAYPKVNETYRLTTWVERWNRHFSERNYMISDQAGNPMGYGRSIWMVLDTHTHESVGLGNLPFDLTLLSTRQCPIKGVGKHLLVMPPEDTAPLPPNAVRATEPPYEYRFKYTDLDFYRHVNTVRYVSLLLNQFTLDEMDRQMVKRLEISFMHEGHYGEDVKVLRANTEGFRNYLEVSAQKDNHPILASAIILAERP